MKTTQKILTIMTASVIIAGVLSGCGKPEPDADSGLYEAVSASMEGVTIGVSDIYENGMSFDLQDGGKCIATIDGETDKMKWSSDGGKVHIEGGGVELDGTIGGGDMTLENIMDTGLDMKFHCDRLLHGDSILKKLRDAKNGRDNS